MSDLFGSIIDVPGLMVGHAQNEEGLTGCSVVICEKGAVGGVDQRGGAPGTRETDALRPMHLVDKVHAVVLAGGSAYGLDASSGVMRFLEERNVGVNVGVGKVPIVSSAILFDLAVGSPKIRPDAAMGYQACLNASANPFPQGNIGAGMGATVGKIFGGQQAMKSGLGTASLEIGGGIIIGAMMAVNAFGDIVDISKNKIIAGARTVKKGPITLGSQDYFADTLQVMRSMIGRSIVGFATRQNTVIGVVATNARLNKEEVNKVAQMAHNGLALAVRPAHTILDGDTIFSMATGEHKADATIVGSFAAQVVYEAIINAIRNASSVDDLPSFRDVPGNL